MTSLLQMTWTVERLLLAEVVAFVCLLAALRLRRFVRDRRFARRVRRSQLYQKVEPREAAGRDPAPAPVTLPASAPRVIPAPSVTPQPLPARAVPLEAMPTAALALVPETAPAPASPVARRRPKPAREAEDTILSPATLLARAHEHLAAHAHEEAATQLRLCVRLAGKLKETPIEAAARLELGDLALASGDLTMACEQWQLARALFSDLKRADDARAAEQRMERAHCPTDWVLTQF